MQLRAFYLNNNFYNEINFLSQFLHVCSNNLAEVFWFVEQILKLFSLFCFRRDFSLTSVFDSISQYPKLNVWNLR